MEQAMRLPEQFHVKLVTTIYILGLVDLVGAVAAVGDVMQRGPSMCILMANEFCLMGISLMATITRYVLNLNDMRRGGPWDHRSACLFYLDFTFGTLPYRPVYTMLYVVDLAKLTVYLVYFATIVAFYGMPIHIIRDLYLTFRSFATRVNDILRYRQATADMENRYPTVSATELAASRDKVCIVCREEMEATPVGPKRLPCGHFFHLRCLRSWLERQQACPTCRKPVIISGQSGVVGQFPGIAAQQQQQHQEAVRVRPADPVMYVAPENIAPVDDRLVLRDTQGTDNPVYLEPVDVRMTTPSNASSASISSSSSKWRLSSLDEQIHALTEVQTEIDALLVKARSLQDAISSTASVNEEDDPNAKSTL